MRSASVRVFARRIRIWNVRQQRRLPAVTEGTIVEWDPPQHPYPRCYSLDSSPVQPQQRQQRQQGGGVGSSTSAAATTTTTTKILELLDERRHPHGSFSPEQFTDANDLLVAALNLRNSDNNAATANACLHLIERMVTEKTLANHPALKSLTFFGHPDTLNAYVKNWFDTAIAAAAQRKTVVEPPGFQWMSAHQLYQKLQSMSARLPEFRYDTTTLGMILNVAIHEQQQQDPTKAPAVAEQLLDDMMKHKQQLQSFTLKLDAVLFTQVIKAWADSRLPEAPDRMELLLQRMWTEGVAPDLVSYTILVRVYANMGAVKKMEAVLESMKQQGLEPDSVCLISLLYCYAKAGQFQWAENVLEYMMSIGKDNHNYRHLIGEGVQHILTAYRQKIAAEKGSRNKQMQALNGAVTFYQAMGQCDNILDARSLDRMDGTMMDIYVQASKLKEAEAIFKRIKYPDAAKYAIMIKGYGNKKKANRAMVLLRDMLRADSRAEPNIIVITAVMNAFAKSHRPERALEVLELMKDDPKCQQLGIRPNAFTYGVLLKCLAGSTGRDAGKSAETVLDDMERRSQAGEPDLKPDEQSLQLAIQACLMAGDVDRAKALKQRMPTSDAAPFDKTSV